MFAVNEIYITNTLQIQNVHGKPKCQKYWHTEEQWPKM